jgi:hypothetical protein
MTRPEERFYMIRAWGAGFIILLIVDMMVVVATLIEVYPQALMLLLRISPFIAAFVSAYLSPRRKVIMGTSMAIPTALLGVLVTFAYQLFGKEVDFRGIAGSLIVFAVSLVYGAVLCAIGGIVGYLLSMKIMTRKMNKERPL